MSVHRPAAVAWFGVGNVLEITHIIKIIFSGITVKRILDCYHHRNMRSNTRTQEYGINSGVVTLSLAKDEADKLYRMLSALSNNKISNVSNKLETSLSAQVYTVEPEELDDTV